VRGAADGVADGVAVEEGVLGVALFVGAALSGGALEGAEDAGGPLDGVAAVGVGGGVAIEGVSLAPGVAAGALDWVAGPADGSATSVSWSPPAASCPTATACPSVGEPMIVRGTAAMETRIPDSARGPQSAVSSTGQTSLIEALL